MWRGVAVLNNLPNSCYGSVFNCEPFSLFLPSLPFIPIPHPFPLFLLDPVLPAGTLHVCRVCSSAVQGVT